MAYFQKRYSAIDPERFEFIPFFYSDYFSRDFFGRIPKDLLNSIGLDALLRSRNPSYIKMLEDFKKCTEDAQIVMFTGFCAIHPNFLHDECSQIVKILPAIDDPPASFERTVPYLFAMDVCTHVSLTYNNRKRMDEQLKIWGAKRVFFTPIGASIPNRLEQLRESDLKNRRTDLIYVGGMYPSKIDRITYLKEEFGDRFELYGRWSPYGLRGVIYTAMHPKKHRLFRWRVRPLAPRDLSLYYQNSKLGINMHWGNAETGNSRLYELPANGVMQICDRGAGNATGEIFEEDKEIVLYDTIEEAVDKIRFYLNHDSHRQRIARAGYNRVMRDYRQEKIYQKLFEDVVKEFSL
ncbi:glycosyltransferase family protein [Nitratifractor sp.]